MSRTPRKGHKPPRDKPPLWARKQVRAALACADCTSIVRFGRRDDGQWEAHVDHQGTCPALPAAARTEGRNRYVVSPVLVSVPLRGGMN